MNNSRAAEITRIVLYAMSIFLIVILAILTCQKILDFKYDTQSDEVMLNAIIVPVQILIMVGNAIFNRQVDSVHFGRKNKKNKEKNDSIKEELFEYVALNINSPKQR